MSWLRATWSLVQERSWPPLGRLRLVVAVLVAAALAVAGVVVESAAPADPLANGLLTSLTSDVLPGLVNAANLGPTNDGKRMDIALALAHPNPAGETALYQSLYNPASSQYHQFLTPSEYAARFGVAPSSTKAAMEWLEGGGLQISQAGAAGGVIAASGTVAQVAALMHTSFSNYSAPATTGAPATTFVANNSPPSVPAGLGVVSVTGLNTLQHFNVGPRSSPPGPAPPTIGGLLPYVGSYTPQQLWSIYSLPAASTGQGQHMGVFIDGLAAPVISSLRGFEQANQLPQVPVSVKQVGTSPPTADEPGENEWELDTQVATGMAPQVQQLTLYDLQSLNDADVLAGFAQWANDPDGPAQMDASFGECETTPLNPLVGNPNLSLGGLNGLGDNLEPAAEPVLLQATLEGRTLFASAGDNGGSCAALVLPVVGALNGLLNEVVPLQSYPAASDYAVSVGGTVLYADGSTVSTRQLEAAWAFSGGGSSGYISEPDFQKLLPAGAVTQACPVNPDGQPYPPGTLCRSVPDVAAFSGDALTNGFAIDDGGSPFVASGTSLSAPLAMGMWARVQAAAPAGGLGFGDETIYKLGTGPTASRDFTDITVGSNGQHFAGPGYDQVSGFGVMNVAGFMADADGRMAPNP